MTNTNPFQKIEGGKSDPQLPEPETGKICVLQGNMVVPVFGNKSGIIGPEARGGGQAVALEAKLFPCQKQRCMFWDDEDKDCTIRMGFEAQIDAVTVLEEVKELLSPLATFFASKG